jgi:hypothetical protein
VEVEILQAVLAVVEETVAAAVAIDGRERNIIFRRSKKTPR